MQKRLFYLSTIIFIIGLSPLWFDFGIYVQDMDFIGQFIPFIVETKRMFSSGSPWWDWNTFFGDNFIGSYSYYTITSPFVWISCLFPYKYILWGILISLYLKFICTAGIAAAYFKKMNLSDQLCILGALLYTFSSFYICNLFYYIFCEPIMLFPLMLIGVENVISNKERCYSQIAIFSFLITFVNFYLAASTFVMAFIYYILRAGNRHALSIRNIVKIIAAQFLGILLSMAIFLPTLLHNMGGTRAVLHTNVSQYVDTKTFEDILIEIIRRFLFLASHILLPMSTEGLPEVFCSKGYTSTQGFITLFGWLPALIYAIKKRNWISWMLGIFIVCYFTPLGGVFSLFTSIAYTRWLYGFILIGILATMFLISENGKIDSQSFTIYVAVTISIVGACIAFQYFGMDSNASLIQRAEWIDIILWVINMAGLILFLRRKKIWNAICFVAICSSLNLAAFTYQYFHTNVPTDNTAEQSFYKYIVKGNIPRSDSDFHYRTDFESNFTNLPILLNRPGIISFHSIYNKQLVDFRQVLQPGSVSPTVFITKDREAVASMMSVKEIYSTGYHRPENDTYDGGLHLREVNADYRIYDYDYYIPMGFSYNSYITESQLNERIAKDSVNVVHTLLQTLVVQDKDSAIFSRHLPNRHAITAFDIDSVSKIRRKFTVSDFVGNTKGFKAKSGFAHDKVVFFSVASDPGFSAYIDGRLVEIYPVNLGMSAIIIPAGAHEIEFKYTPPGIVLGMILSFIALIILIWMVIIRI